MMQQRPHLLLLSILLFSVGASAKTQLPSQFSDQMVLQRDHKNTIWGFEDQNDSVKVEIGTHKTTVGVVNGYWSCELPVFPAGGQYTLNIRGSESIAVQDITFGDVYLISGQSNMELQIRRVLEKYPDAAKKSENPNIRLFRVPTEYDFHQPLKALTSGSWKKSNPQNTAEFSAIGYFFAKQIHENHQVPVGIISTAVGGSPVECWIPTSDLSDDLKSLETLKKFQTPGFIEEAEATNSKHYQEWSDYISQNDQGIQANPQWNEDAFIAENWKSIEVPGVFENDDFKGKSGVFWLRKTFEIPNDWDLQQAKLYLGCIVDADTTYINGQKVGNTTYRYPPRIYPVAPEILKKGTNTITIRFEVHGNHGEFVPDKKYLIQMGEHALPLDGEWKYEVGCHTEKRKPTTFVRWQPTGLYNGMIAPLKDFGIKGILWYQGESNAGNQALTYRTKLIRLIERWRDQFNNPELPFIYVQLANFMEPQTKPEESNWAVLREQQRLAESHSNTKMVVAIDLGEWNDIHPLNKMGLATRLAKSAEALVYHKTIIHQGPRIDHATIIDGKIKLIFKPCDSPLVAKNDSKLHCFEIAGKDKVFRSVEARIDGNSVVIDPPNDMEPQWIRYAWANNPDQANLYNTCGFPASPFEIEIDSANP